MATSTKPAKLIPFFNYQGAFASGEEEFIEVIRDVIRRGAFIQQRDLAEFENDLARFLGVKHAIGVGNATDGLIFALKAAGIRPGDEVIFPSHTMVASAAAIVHAGGIPVPVECGADHLVDAGSVESAITDQTWGILPVQLNGRTCNMEKLQAIADRYDLTIVEDAAQALGSRFDGNLAGTFGAAGVFSFYPAKVLGCFGDGGAVVTNDDVLADRVRLFRDHGRDPTGDVQVWGFNSRLDNMQAAVLHLQLKRYPDAVERRRRVAALYTRLLQDIPEVTLPPSPDSDPRHFDVFQNYEIEAEHRDDLRAYLKSEGVTTLIQWGGKPVHQFTSLGFRSMLPKTDELFRRCLMLPLNTMITDDEVSDVSNLIRRFYREAKWSTS